MAQRIPVFVLPLQPEQAHNGVCLERMGCGRRLVRGVVFTGQADYSAAALLERSVDSLADEMSAFLADQCTGARLTWAAEQVSNYGGVNELAKHLEASP
jgi:hypothetical protein